jgi:prepilin-type N-terminal cleavage/methylation domain-containing protein
MAVVRTGSSSAPRARPRSVGRPGYSLVELLAALSIFAVVTALLYGALSAQVRLSRAAAERVAAADAVRTASHILAGEARRMSSADVRAAAADSVALRSFRGMAVVCTASSGELTVRYRGDRLPVASKDSVLVIAGAAAPHAAALEAAAAAPPSDVSAALPSYDDAAPRRACAPMHGETAMTWLVPAAGDGAVVGLLFESGVYSISSRALRYRRGAEGRQPLTAELLVQPPSRLGADGDGLFATLAAGRLPAVRMAAPFSQWNQP